MTSPLPGERWWVIHEYELLKALQRCEHGETADLMLLELTANSEPSESEES